MDTGSILRTVSVDINLRKEHAVETGKVMRWIKQHRASLALAVITVLFAVTRLWQFGVNPAGMHVDEAGMAYDAYNLAHFGTDRYQNPFPVYLINFDAGQSALYAYLAALFIKIFGFSMTAVRLPALLSGVLVYVFGYLIVKEMWDRRTAVLTALFIAICPYFIMASRWGLDCNLLLGFFTMSVYWLMLAVKKEKTGLFIAAGISLGLTLYTYALTFLILPLFLLFTLIYLFSIRRLKLKNLFALGIPVFLLALPLMFMLAVNNGLLPEIKTGFFTIPKLLYYRGAEFSPANIPKNLKLFWTLLTHDHLDYNADPQFGTLYYISLPLVAAGAVLYMLRSWKDLKNHKEYSPRLIPLFMFFSALICALVVFDGYIINKSNAVYLMLAVFIALGIQHISKWHRALGPVMTVLYGTLFLFFGKYYYVNHAQDLRTYFYRDLTEAVRYVDDTVADQEQRRIYVDAGEEQQPYIFICLEEKITPEEFTSSRQDSVNHYRNYYFELPSIPEEDAVYIIATDKVQMELLDEAGFSYTQCGKYRIYIKK